jgi:hypothetical protein
MARCTTAPTYRRKPKPVTVGSGPTDSTRRYCCTITTGLGQPRRRVWPRGWCAAGRRQLDMEQDRGDAGELWQGISLLFTTRHGTPIEPRNFNRYWDRRCALARVPRITIRDARRTCGSLLADLDVHLGWRCRSCGTRSSRSPWRSTRSSRPRRRGPRSSASGRASGERCCTSLLYAALAILLKAAFPQVSAGRTMHHTNRSTVVVGEPMPGHLTSSRRRRTPG